MANSAVAVTAGSGTNVDTFTQASGDHRQAMVIGDQDQTYTARVGAEGGLWVVPRGGVRYTSTHYVEAAAPGTSAALVTLNRTIDGVAQSTGTAFTVTSGRTARIQAILASITLVGTTVANTRIALRAVPSGGTLSATSPVVASWRIGNWSIGTQAAGYTQQTENLTIPDGLEFTSGMVYGFTLQTTTASMHTVDLNMFSYEVLNVPA